MFPEETSDAGFNKATLSKARYVLRNNPISEGADYPQRCLDIMAGSCQNPCSTATCIATGIVSAVALVKNNRQGELSPLEIGLHALAHVELDKRGLGATGGGLKGYAEGVGYAANNISKYRNAAIVYQTFIKANVSINDEAIKANESLLDKTNHLGEIHKAPSECWRVLVELLRSQKTGAVLNRN